MPAALGRPASFFVNVPIIRWELRYMHKYHELSPDASTRGETLLKIDCDERCHVFLRMRGNEHVYLFRETSSLSRLTTYVSAQRRDLYWTDSIFYTWKTITASVEI